MSLLEGILITLFIRLGRPVLFASILTLLGCFAARADAVEEVRALNSQAAELYRKGEYAEAFVVGERTLSLAEKTLGPEHSLTLACLNDLAAFHERQGRYNEAEPLLKRALEGREKTLGPEHPYTLISINNLGMLYERQGRYSEAEPLVKRALAGREKVLGPEHPETLRSVNNLGGIYQMQRRYGEAEPLLRRALAGAEKALGPEHPDTLESVNNLGFLYYTEGRYSQAEPLLKRALAGHEKALGPDHPETLPSVGNLALLYQAQGRYGEAELLHKRALAVREKMLGPEHPETLRIVNNLGFLYFEQRRYGEAEPLLKRALAGAEKALGPEHPSTLTTVDSLATLYQRQGRYSEAEPLLKRALAGRQKTLGAEHPDTLQSINNLGMLYQAQRRDSEVTFLTVTIGGKNYRLAALVAKEAGSTGRLPVALITHGQPEPEKRKLIEPWGQFFLAREFARRGWLAVVVVRRGFGRSDRGAPYAARPCQNGEDYASELKDETDDLEASIEAIGRRSDADISTVLAVGQSVGGAVSLDLAARHPKGLKAVVSFAGGIKSAVRPGVSPSTACKPEDLIPLFARYGERSRLPTLWLYAKNDSLFPPDYVRSLHEAYVAKGGQAQLHIFDPVGQEGHLMVGDPRGMLHWLPALDRFLRDNKLKTYDPAPIERALRDRYPAATALRVMSGYEGLPTEKVLAISQHKGGLELRFGGEDLAAMENEARESCEKGFKEPCRVVLRNFEAVPWDDDAGEAPRGVPLPSAPRSPTATKGVQ